MNRPQQTVAIAICALGLLVVAIGAAVLLSELKKERSRREELESEVTELRDWTRNLLGCFYSGIGF